MAEAFGGVRNVVVKEDVRLREQHFGNYQVFDEMETEKEARRRYGEFYYRFNSGESAADVYLRVSSFLESFYRFVELRGPLDTVVIVSHGLAIKSFCMRWEKRTVEDFESWGVLGNCDMCVYEERQVNGRPRLVFAFEVRPDGTRSTTRTLHRGGDD
jgi:broad specificity phosphatase PhoE